MVVPGISFLDQISAQAGVTQLIRQQPNSTDHQSPVDGVLSLEKVLAKSPSHQHAAIQMLMVLDRLSPQIPGTGPYSECQKQLGKSNRASELSTRRLHMTEFLRCFDEWQSILNNFNVNQSPAITQLYEGK